MRGTAISRIFHYINRRSKISLSYEKLSFGGIFVRHASNNVIEDLQNRKLIQSIFPNESTHLPDIIKSGVNCAYAGFDPTSDSLHLGNLAVLMSLLHWTRTGHNAIALIGSGTAMIGDPSGRNTEREAAREDIIQNNSVQIQNSLKRIFENYLEIFDKEIKAPPIRILNNMLWYENAKLVEFLSTEGRYFKIGEMIARTSVQNRLNSKGGISFCEFSYQVFQAYDWMHLLQNYNCHFQFGGMDQMGNIHGGRDIISRVRKQHVYGLMLPLLLTEVGDKYGKSAGNAIWLDAEKTSPYELYQFFLRLSDKETESYLGIFLFDTIAEIETLLEEHSKATERRLPQKRLAETVTLLVHGEIGLESAIRCTNALFHSTSEILSQLSPRDLRDVFGQAPAIDLEFKNVNTILDLALEAHCFKSIVDAERVISGGGFYLNLKKITNSKTLLSAKDHILKNGISLLRVGKRNYYLVRWK